MFKRFLFAFLIYNYSIICLATDQVIFFNVGEGHCALAYKQGFDPLLIDAGSRRKALVEENLQEFERPLGTNGQLTVQQLTDRGC